jgi:hypothetical protein
VLATNNRRGRPATIPVTAFVLVEIFDDEPWRLAQNRLNPENGANLFATAGAAYRSRRAIGAWPTHAGPDGAGQGRQPAEPGAHSASLDRRRLVRQRLARPNGAARPNRAASLAHCADRLSTKENPNSCKVRPCQKSCDKSLHCHTIDRGAPWALYPAIKRSIVCASPVLRYPSPSRHRTKTRTSRTRAGCARIWRSWISRVFVNRRCSPCLLAGRGQNAGAVAAAPVVSNSGAGSRHAERFQSEVIVAGIVDSGR